MKAQPVDVSPDEQLLDEVEFARLLNCDPGLLLKTARRHRIFYVEVAGKRLYTAFLAGPAVPSYGVRRVIRRLQALPAGSKLQFFIRPKASLGGGTPLECLRAGSLANVLKAADGFAGR